MHSHDHLHATSKVDNSKEARNVTLVGMAVNIILSFLKILVGSFSHSAALVADGIHSLSDLLTDVLVLVVTRYSNEAPDAEHPYGHGRFETLATVVLGSLLIAVAGGMLLDSTERLLHVNNTTPGALALVIASLSILSKEWLYHYTAKVGKKIRSNLLIANAWHHRSDALSSIVVFFGIGGAILGINWLDPLAELIVSIMVAKIGIDLAWSSMKELVDTALSEEETLEIRAFIKEIAGVRDVHDLRSRLMGSDAILDVHIQVSPAISVSEGHQIGLIVTHKLRQKFPYITDVTFHIDAEADEHSELDIAHRDLPLRRELIEQLALCWKGLLTEESIKNVKLHYLNHRVSVEVFLSDEEFTQLQGKVTGKELLKACTELGFIRDVSLWARV